MRTTPVPAEDPESMVLLVSHSLHPKPHLTTLTPNTRVAPTEMEETMRRDITAQAHTNNKPTDLSYRPEDHSEEHQAQQEHHRASVNSLATAVEEAIIITNNNKAKTTSDGRLEPDTITK